MWDITIVDQRAVINVSLKDQAVEDALASAASAEASAAAATAAVETNKALLEKISLIPKPANKFGYVPFEILKYNTKSFLSNDDWLDLFKSKYPGFVSGGIVYVDPASGNDTFAGTIFAPLKTITAGMNAAGSFVYLKSGNYDFFDFRNTSTRGTVAKIFIGLTDQVYLRYTGDVISSLTFTQDTVNANVFHATLTTTNLVKRLLRSDIMDNDGLPTPIALRSSTAEVASSGYGWFYDIPTKKLTIRFANSVGANATERESWFANFVKPHLSASYLGSTVSTQRIYIQNTKVFLKNIKIEGGYIFANKTSATAAGVKPVIWCDNVQMKYTDTTGFTIQGGESFAKDVYITRSNGDNFGYHVENGVECEAVEYNVLSTYAGDVDTYPATSQNKNASSMHENGTILRIDSEYRNSYPYDIIDTGIGGVSTGGSWNVGVVAKGSTSTNIRMFDRTVYLDHVTAKDIIADVGSTIIYNDLVNVNKSTVGGGILQKHNF